MDPRKIQFLIAMQREIDKVESQEGESSTRVERLKSRFYDVVEVAEMVGNGEETKLSIDKETDLLELVSSEDINKGGGGITQKKYTPQEREKNQAELEQVKQQVESIKQPLVATRKNKEVGEKNNVFLNKSRKTYDSSIAVIPEPVGEPKRKILPPKISDATLFDLNEGNGSVAVRKNPAGQKKTVRLQSVELTKGFLHKPKDVAAFLIRFRERKNRGLKYLTHRWSDMKRDNSLTYEEVIENAKKEFQECIDMYVIPEMLQSKVREFVKTKSWSGKNRKGYLAQGPRFFYSVVNGNEIERVIVDSGWSSDEMIEWVKNNPQSDPNQDDYWKGKLINPFKKAIEVRDGMFEEYLRMNAEVVLKDKYALFNPIYSESLKEARFFTDVPTLFEGIRQLLDTAKEKAQIPGLKFDYLIPDSDELYGIRQIKIVTDKNSQIGSLITKEQLIKGGNFGEAYDHFYGLCNWSILCQRGSEYVRMNLLSDIDGIKEIEPIDSHEVEGFTHILTFYDL